LRERTGLELIAHIRVVENLREFRVDLREDVEGVIPRGELGHLTLREDNQLELAALFDLGLEVVLGVADLDQHLIPTEAGEFAEPVTVDEKDDLATWVIGQSVEIRGVLPSKNPAHETFDLVSRGLLAVNKLLVFTNIHLFASPFSLLVI